MQINIVFYNYIFILKILHWLYVAYKSAVQLLFYLQDENCHQIIYVSSKIYFVILIKSRRLLHQKLIATHLGTNLQTAVQGRCPSTGH
jgi:hypothetical protein